VAADSLVRRPGDPGRRTDRAHSMRPLRRKPKTLTEEPSLTDVSPTAAAGGGVALGGEPGNRSDKPATSAGSGGAATTDEQAALTAVFTDSQAVADPETLRRAREIAARLAVRRPRRDRTTRRGHGEIASVPYRGSSDDIDLDRTTGEQDPELARDLARLGRGLLRQVRTYRDVAPALSEFFAG
jgi:hypothetical protein